MEVASSSLGEGKPASFELDGESRPLWMRGRQGSVRAVELRSTGAVRLEISLPEDGGHVIDTRRVLPGGDELERILAASDRSIAERIEMAAGAWIDTLVARPTLARLLMRFVADGPEPHAHGIFSDDDQVAMRFLALFEEGCASGELRPVEDNVFLVASSVVGTTIFYAGALATLVPQQDQAASMEAEQVAGLKREVLRAMRHLLGIQDTHKRRTRQKKAASTRR